MRVDPVKLLNVPDDLACAHPTRIHRHDLFVEAWEAALIFSKQLRIETRLPVAWNGKLKPAAIGQNRLSTVAIQAVAGSPFAREVMIHLRVQSPLRQRFLQLIEQPVVLKCRLRVRTRQKLVQDAIWDNRLFSSCHG